MNVDSRSLDRVIRQVHALEPLVANALSRGLTRGMAILTDAAQEYPPERPQQTYVRTYDLRRGWQRPAELTRSASLITSRVINPVGYSGVVQDGHDQAAIHRGRWLTTAAIQERHEARVHAVVEDEVRQALRSSGL